MPARRPGFSSPGVAESSTDLDEGFEQERASPPLGTTSFWSSSGAGPQVLSYDHNFGYDFSHTVPDAAGSMAGFRKASGMFPSNKVGTRSCASTHHSYERPGEERTKIGGALHQSSFEATK
jgi:hypothetical protein